jgi:branched-chain amino acid transport system substrate-binding protein
MKKMINLVLLVCMLSVVLVGCQSNTGSETIKIGYIGALSGETAVWGQAGLNGMKLTADEINEKGGILGKKVEIIGLDAAANRLIR